MVPRYLRLSLTARCNLRCFYCRGTATGDASPGAWEPAVDEIATLARAAVAEGISKFRLTGG